MSVAIPQPAVCCPLFYVFNAKCIERVESLSKYESKCSIFKRVCGIAGKWSLNCSEKDSKKKNQIQMYMYMETEENQNKPNQIISHAI